MPVKGGHQGQRFTPAGDGLWAATVGGKTAVVSANVTRPANTTQYAAGEVINAGTPAVLTFQNVASVEGGTGVIISAGIVGSGNETTKPQLKLWLFTAAPTPDSDNAAFTPTDAEMLNLIGVVDFTAESWHEGTAGTGGNSYVQLTGVNLPFVCAASVDDIYGVLTVHNAYTPLSGEVFTVKLGIVQD